MDLLTKDALAFLQRLPTNKVAPWDSGVVHGASLPPEAKCAQLQTIAKRYGWTTPSLRDAVASYL